MKAPDEMKIGIFGKEQDYGFMDSLIFVKKFIDFQRERKGERERNIDLLFHLLMHSLVDFCVCPDGESNSQPWYIGAVLSPTELLGQG